MGRGGGGEHSGLKNQPHRHFVLSLVSLAPRDQDSGPSNSTNDTYDLSEKYGTVNSLHFSVEGKHFENGAFRKRRRHNKQVISLPSFLQTQIQNPKFFEPILKKTKGRYKSRTGLTRIADSNKNSTYSRMRYTTIRAILIQISDPS